MIQEKQKRTWEITYKGPGISLNDFYSQGHWHKRVGIKNKYSAIFRDLIEKAGVEKLDQYSLLCIYNSRHDPSNISGMIKLFEDTLAGNKSRVKKTFRYTPLIGDDSKKYCKGIHIVPDLSLKINTFKFILTEENGDTGFS